MIALPKHTVYMKHPFILSLGLILAAWGTLSFVHQTAQYPNKKKEKEYYQLTIYRFSKQQQEAILDNYFQEALLPALHRLGIKNIGVFKNINNDTSEQKEAYVIIPATSLEKLYALKEKLSTDKAYLQTGNAYINAPASAAPYDRLETILLKSFKLAPTLKIPALKGVRKTVYTNYGAMRVPPKKYFKINYICSTRVMKLVYLPGYILMLYFTVR